MTLERVQRVYETLGKEDPLWAVLTDDRFRGNKWDPSEFFATGQAEIASVMTELAAQHIDVERNAALDFGCGVGRLTQALCEHFESVVGIDISASMVAGAETWNRHADRCHYLVNTTDDIPVLASASLDFIYSSISLQHSPPRCQRNYLREFMRLLKPGAAAVFQVRIGPHRRDGSPSERWYRLRSETLRPLWKRLRGRPPVQLHTISEKDVRETIADAGGEVLASVDADASRRSSRKSVRFTVRKLR